ncbi:hypothetical protein Pmi06nite_63890 [Planotetraspora mira]|uniref:Uncharacterized protein n=1 Tax=Planotetraspora mira TaxID=58121 RepID=A0A8J3X982_9ACTN|nr:hypothetical protein Pmi06nite_63890 [Planotetraspora mira]
MKTTCAPSRANRRTIAAPIPRDPPVTKAVFPASGCVIADPPASDVQPHSLLRRLNGRGEACGTIVDQRAPDSKVLDWAKQYGTSGTWQPCS